MTSVTRRGAWMSWLAALLPLALLAAASSPAAAQRLPGLRFAPAAVVAAAPGPAIADSSSRGARFGQALPAAVAGSAVGLVAGWYGGAQLGIGGGDDPGLTGAVLGAAFGSAMGAALGAAAVHRAHGVTRPLEYAIGAGLAGMGAGIVTTVVASGLGARERGLFVAYVIGQGAATAAITSATWR